jgi:hypothetical protein
VPADRCFAAASGAVLCFATVASLAVGSPSLPSSGGAAEESSIASWVQVKHLAAVGHCTPSCRPAWLRGAAACAVSLRRTTTYLRRCSYKPAAGRRRGRRVGVARKHATMLPKSARLFQLFSGSCKFSKIAHVTFLWLFSLIINSAKANKFST